MKIIISKRTGKVLRNSIYTIIRSFDLNKGASSDFKPDEAKMKSAGVKLEDLADLVKLDNQIRKKSNAKN